MKSGKSWKKSPYETNSSSSLITTIPTVIDFLIISIRSFRVQKDLSWILERSGKKDQERIEKWWRKESRTRNDRRPLKILLVLLVKHLSVAQTQSNVITSTRISLLKQIFSVYSFSFSKWETGRGVSSKLFYSHRMEQASSTFLQYFITPRFEICRSLPVFLLLNHTVSDMVFFYGSLFEENGSFQVVIMILCLRLQIPTVSFLHCLLKKEIFKNIPRID